ncbi:hypothetical protein J14TS2_22730 [Bacillus sp. J14TS2]|uniref:hypothetical protein n=1 Tax=Bacillus sp. J14TS2 TaxID=2807188 RepID=UPI001B2CD100|nr:hypothetical protein [Bacillus sp. J14TS2]GIN71798.1 hypothetical protein J14TS2_22730 [Bacillus sp. J14TS2]
MDFESQLKKELKREGELINSPEHLKAHVYSAIQKDRIIPRKINWIKRLIVSVLAAGILILVGVFADKTIIPELIKTIIGTP